MAAPQSQVSADRFIHHTYLTKSQFWRLSSAVARFESESFLPPRLSLSSALNPPTSREQRSSLRRHRAAVQSGDRANSSDSSVFKNPNVSNFWCGRKPERLQETPHSNDQADYSQEPGWDFNSKQQLQRTAKLIDSFIFMSSGNFKASDSENIARRCNSIILTWIKVEIFFFFLSCLKRKGNYCIIIKSYWMLCNDSWGYWKVSQVGFWWRIVCNISGAARPPPHGVHTQHTHYLSGLRAFLNLPANYVNLYQSILLCS